MRHLDGKSLSPQTFSLLGEKFVKLAEVLVPQQQQNILTILEEVSKNRVELSPRILDIKKNLEECMGISPEKEAPETPRVEDERLPSVFSVREELQIEVKNYASENLYSVYKQIALDLGLSLEKMVELDFSRAGVAINSSKPYSSEELKELSEKIRSSLFKGASKNASSPFPPLNNRWADRDNYVRLLNDLWASSKNADFTDDFKSYFEANYMSDYFNKIKKNVLNKGEDHLILRVEDYEAWVDALKRVAKNFTDKQESIKVGEKTYYKSEIEKNMKIMEFDDYSYAAFASITLKDLAEKYREKALGYHEDHLRRKLNDNKISQEEYDRSKPIYEEKFKAISVARKYLKEIKEKM